MSTSTFPEFLFDSITYAGFMQKDMELDLDLISEDRGHVRISKDLRLVKTLVVQCWTLGTQNPTDFEQ